tara:strand:+ start:230 stop:1411 length:1182 start_codon:yes stop_codon:yes gene_type:complete
MPKNRLTDNLSDIWKLKKRGKRDSDRHKELVKDAIKKQGRDLITEYNIIRSDGNKKVKVPIKFLDQYKIKNGSNPKGGVGQGLDAKPGDRYRVRKQSKKPGDSGAGNEEGEVSFEAEVSIDELVDILLEELNLPWMEPKDSSEIEIENDEFSSIEKKGIMPNLDIKKTLIENIKRNAAAGDAKVGSFKNEDLRYKTWDVEKEYQSNAAIYMMMDRSGSMSEEKRYIAKSFYFWMGQFLKRRYKNIKIYFIAHDVRAYFVNENEFFSINSGGGTACSSAFKAAYEHIVAHHSAQYWNNYVFEFSDGDNWGDDNRLCVEYVQKLLPLVTAIGYGEIDVNGGRSWMGAENLLSSILHNEINRTRFVSLKISSKDDVFDALRSFFNIDRFGYRATKK